MIGCVPLALPVFSTADALAEPVPHVRLTATLMSSGTPFPAAGNSGVLILHEPEIVSVSRDRRAIATTNIRGTIGCQVLIACKVQPKSFNRDPKVSAASQPTIRPRTDSRHRRRALWWRR